ncbi:TPA: hypothetical protein N0F65_010312 [Lagenidium giganteum]|uniref:Uncharacterized protein n=1 Tax=Lagenidium giganteum TaxID=4803 RepID=A0AAV2Z2R7_9STRA|nr:TPA: hypothetical protein N0F65_010312 [Lagenidium giganteum]
MTERSSSITGSASSWLPVTPDWRTSYAFVRWSSFVLSVLWNLSSPLKSWLLSRYGFDSSEVSLSEGLQWITSIDYGIAKQLYADAGVELDLPDGQSTRFLNVYLDFMFFRKSTSWAHLVNHHHDDFYEGRYCRSTLVYRGDRAEAQLAKWRNTGVEFWTWTITDFVRDEEHGCAVHEVAEAVLCLKGINASDFINLDYKTALDPHDPEVHAMLVRYQELVLPDLNSCLARRASLLSAMGDAKLALQRLAAEIAANYTLDLRNRAGEANLFLDHSTEYGFVDINGHLSGQRHFKLAGTAAEVRSPGIEPLAPIREILYICSTILPVNMTLLECIDRWAVVLPGIYMGWAGNDDGSGATNAGWYPISGDAFQFASSEGIIRKYNQLNRGKVAHNASYLPLSAITSDLTQSAYRDEVDRIMFQAIFGDQIEWSKGDELMKERCYVRDACFDACLGENATNGLDFTFAYRDPFSNQCTSKVLSYTMNNRGYVSRECYGIGKGNSSIRFMFNQNKYNQIHVPGLKTYVVNDTADPFEIFACIMGGRIPSGERLPENLPDFVDTRTNMIFLQSFERGSEQIFLNFYELLTLLGCTIFACWVAKVSVSIIRHTSMRADAPNAKQLSAQLRYSLTRTSVAIIVWDRGLLLLRCFGFVSLVTWYLHATGTSCSWSVNGQDIWQLNSTDFLTTDTQEPLYSCQPGALHDFFWPFKAAARLQAASYTLFIMVFNGRLIRGLTRTAYGFSLALVFLGALPLLVTAVIITEINRARLTAGVMESVHNQLFVTLLWAFSLLSLWLLRRHLIDWVSVPFRRLGIRRQLLLPQRGLQRIIGSYYFVHSSEFISHAIGFVPLSVCFESREFEFHYIILGTREYNDFKDRAGRKPSLQKMNTPVTERLLEQQTEYCVVF